MQIPGKWVCRKTPLISLDTRFKRCILGMDFIKIKVLFLNTDLSHCTRKPTICLWGNKGTDQLRSNCEADQRLCFRHMDSSIPLLLKSEISSFYPSSVTVQPGLCQTLSEPKLLVFSRTGTFLNATATTKSKVT